ncbi:MAG: ribonuclease D [Kordiimonadaceae bacterium]|jgi:ribonuclease D|nr:ribonuclease D [Kordiimonadaceae bacterium]MBT6036382.1 ribonuclease D [Kordiimonadaceae bacterium]MBT6329401.1 ribonuclease D [Kordiimonadaceae bacterium]MBT7583822.1 ribonuclease D [Kordiimonadaceae bacterium]
MSVITTSEALKALCERLSKSDYVTVDTEFLRDKTYYSKLCLIQIADDNEYHAIDTLIGGLDLTPFYDLMENEKVLKVFHAAKQDIEILVNMANVVPKPLFDSQIAAMVCGFGDSIGYEKLVLALCNKQLDKSTRFTDWSRRPLTERQIDYALGDVTHLRVIYKKLQQQLEDTNRVSWLTEDIAEMLDKESYTIKPENAWKRVKIRNSNRRFNAIVHKLAEWREAEAQRRNIPRNRVMRDEVMLELSAVRPTHTNALTSVRGLGANFATSKGGNAVIEAIKEAMALSDDELPVISRRKPPSQNTDPIVELLKVLLKLVCKAEDVAPKLLANVEDLERLAENDEADVKALHGWRYDLFGKNALALKNGEVAFAIKDGEIEVFDHKE